MLDVTHGCTDPCVRGMDLHKQLCPNHFQQTRTNSPLLNQLENKHACMYANLQKNSVHFLSMSYTYIHINQTCILPSKSPVKKSVSTAAHIGPAPILCNSNNTIATSWITSSITCIRFDGVKVLATI